MSWVVGVEGVCGAFPDGCAVTLGVFDGVHRGHAALVEATVRWARAHDVPAVALTFEPHPAAVLAPDRRPPMLCPLAHRVQKLQRLGIDVVIVQPFTQAFSELSATAFIEQVLVRGLRAPRGWSSAMTFGLGIGGAAACKPCARRARSRCLPCRACWMRTARRFRRRACAS
jgi:FAD synthase